MATVEGYEVVYTHRGSWKANRSYAGKIIDQVPVAWDRDYTFGKPPQLVIWFQDVDEAAHRLASGMPFIAALSRKKPDGASSNDIRRLFEVEPVETVTPDPGTRSGVRCNVLDKVAAPAKRDDDADRT